MSECHEFTSSIHGLNAQRGISRRDALLGLGAASIGPVSLWNGALGQARLRAAESSLPATAKSIIFLSLYGGPPHQDTYDMKPDAPLEVRGEFQSIATTLPGFQICEYMPKLARLAHLYTIARSVTHKDNGHESAFYALMTGWPHPQPNTIARPEANDYPSFGTIINYLKATSRPVPGFMLTGGATSTGIGQTAGFLGSSWAPYLVQQDANEPSFGVPELTLLDEVPSSRLAVRRRLLNQLDNLNSVTSKTSRGSFVSHQKLAFEMLAAPKIRAAFEIQKESVKTRDAYGHHPFGQNVLLARRLVEAEVPVVQINWRNRGDGGLDTHSNNFNMCKGSILPKLDGCLSALLTDLEKRGLLDQTLVIAAGEFGRTPTINRDAGRDHWAGCNSILLAGGGIKRGFVFGASDRTGAYPATDAIGPWDIHATLLHCYGIDPATVVRDSSNQRRKICSGNVIPDLLQQG